MGEANANSKKRQALLQQNTCIYCNRHLRHGDDFEEEHMPPRSIFDEKNNVGRPNDWTFLCCSTCNKATRGADAVAALFALTSPTSEQEWQVKKIKGLMSAITKHAPDAHKDIQRSIRLEELRIRLQPKIYRSNRERPSVYMIQPEGPGVKRNMDLFSTKVALCTFDRLVGRRINNNNVIITMWHLNAGMSQDLYDRLTSIMPNFTQLQQGQKVSGHAFSLRYNTDEKSIVASTASMHNNLFITSIATDDSTIADEVLSDFREHEDKKRPHLKTLNVSVSGIKPMLTTVL